MVQHTNVPALKKQWVLDAQWTDCPKDVEEVVQQLWRYHELGNDNYMLRRSINDFLQSFGDDLIFEGEIWHWPANAMELPDNERGWLKKPISLTPLINYIRSAGIPDDEEIIIHWWW